MFLCCDIEHYKHYKPLNQFITGEVWLVLTVSLSGIDYQEISSIFIQYNNNLMILLKNFIRFEISSKLDLVWSSKGQGVAEYNNNILHIFLKYFQLLINISRIVGCNNSNKLIPFLLYITVQLQELHRKWSFLLSLSVIPDFSF